ncbi:MAG: MBL fold metallo-hydrolase [Succinivibrionaceae bacterium]|nr:MBL fold metallo-hydrolase [Succinivibrionaceae bacterium]
MLSYSTVVVGAFQVNCRIIASQDKTRCAIADPGDDPELVKNAVKRSGAKPVAVILTHGHLDHCGAAAEIAALYGIPVFGPEAGDRQLLEHLDVQARMFGLASKPALRPDLFLSDNGILDLNLGEEIRILHCPGHTPGQVCYYFKESGFLLSGDVLFRRSVGRSDFPGGDHDQLISSIRDNLLILPDDTAVLPGHGPDTTIGEEKLYNPFLSDFRHAKSRVRSR